MTCNTAATRPPTEPKMPSNAPKTSRHLEVERKSTSSSPPCHRPSRASPRWRRWRNRRCNRWMRRTSTRRRRTWRNKITLRRPTGGTDAGWHLKLPAGPDARTEVRAPLTSGPAEQDTVPTELRDVVLAIVRDRPLEPVARSPPNAKPKCCTTPGAQRWRSSATTTSPRRRPRRRTARTRNPPNKSGASGKSSSGKARRARKATGPLAPSS